MKRTVNIKAVILLLALICLAAYFMLVNSWQQGLESGPGQAANQEQLKPVTNPLGNKPVNTLPDFDQRKLAKVREAAKELVAVDASFNADEVLAQSEQQLDVIIQEYNQVLDDPGARKALEQRMKEAAQAYKKAVLAKVNKGEI
ncbi:hypothetical protein SG34_022565 [Thalassomonas viridans]|uniref:Uncharacterized protein n=1 Tax=Thalassomonas viridans TaxID=137584 RepID=A0AAE9Z147_9GAMM|nr:hypothetical protein [Thalassomonas viridans]WDE04114.1 hypothetical protein SG34_022565 [Thalassomonas viridans]